MLTNFFGYNKYVHLQVMGKFLLNRFQCFYYQYSGILNQQKTFIQLGRYDDKHYKIDGNFAEIPYLLKEKLAKYLFNPAIRYEAFFQNFVPEIASMPLVWSSPIDILHFENDKKFHQNLVSKLKEMNHFYFDQFKEL